MNNPLASFFVGRQMAGGDGVDRSAENSAKTDAKIAENNAAQSQETSLVLALALRKERNEVMDWRRYANRLNVNLAARKMSEVTLLAALKEANINHPLATEEGFEAMFDKALEAQYSKADAERASSDTSSFEQKSLEEVGKERADVK